MPYYGDTERDRLKTLSVMQSYCNAKLGSPKREGNAWMYDCPVGTHNRKKLRVQEHNGIGWAHCWACDWQGDIFDLAAAILRVDRDSRFGDLIEDIARTCGIPLRESTGTRPRRLSAADRRNQDALRKIYREQAQTASPEPSPAAKPLNIEDVRASLARAATDTARMDYWARVLGIDAYYLRARADAELAPYGQLGLDAAGHLQYIYTDTDSAGKVIPVAVKTRNFPGEQPRMWYAAGAPTCLFGAAEIAHHRSIYITEGESDSLALNLALDCWRDLLMEEATDRNIPQIPFESTPFAAAKPSAGTFKPEWARQLRGKVITLIVDRDPAGQAGAQKTADILRSLGCSTIYSWTPPPEYHAKDARDAYIHLRSTPVDLIDNIQSTRQLAL